MIYTVEKPFNTATRRLWAGMQVTTEDVAGQIPVADLVRMGFLAEPPPEPAAVEAANGVVVPVLLPRPDVGASA